MSERAPLRVRWSGALESLSAQDKTALVERARSEADPVIAERVKAILSVVREQGDDAVLSLAAELDGVRLEALEVPASAMGAALAALDPSIRRGLERAKTNIERVHRAFLPGPAEVESEPGVIVGRRPEPLAAVGVYAPGGRAAYPSSVLMGVVPARVAGVRDVVVCSPPSKSGRPSDVVLAAAAIAGATRVFSIGGAQAIAAMAFGTHCVPRVDRIVGPGNAYVAEAKRQVAGHVGIDAPAGPSEILVLADETADAAHIAREMIAQAEHDPEASCVALVSSADVAQRVLGELASATPDKYEVVAHALSSRGAVLSFSDWSAAYELASDYGAEHLLLAVRDPDAALEKIRHAGTVFFGEGASVAFGDYMTGANHVLPTAGAARSFSGLSTLDFIRWTTYQRVSKEAAAAMAEDVGLLADAEGLPGHAVAARAHSGSVPHARRRAAPHPRASYGKMRLYSSNRRPAPIDLSDNTNTAGAPPSAIEWLDGQHAHALSRYPSHYGEGLKSALAARLGVSTEEIVTGCGSDDVLDSAIRAFADPGDALAYSVPTFAMVPFFCHMNGLVPRPVPLRGSGDHYDIDAEALLATGARIIYVCSPNNPTGTLASRGAIERVIEGAPGLVVLDEAYIDYAGQSLVNAAKDAGRLLVVRTLSKAYGLAGARVGYAVGAPALVAEVEKSRGPYKITQLAERMAEAVIERDQVWVEARIAEVLASRERMEAWLGQKGFRFLPSSANFVLVLTENANDKGARLRERGIAVRPFPALEGFGDALRISVGPWSLMETILGSLEEVLSS